MGRFRSRGQATIELIAVLPFCVLALAACAEGIIAVWIAAEAEDAARAGSRAAAIGADGSATARAALPELVAHGASITVVGTRVRIRLPLPGLLAPFADAIVVEAS